MATASARKDPSAGIDEQRIINSLEANVIESDTIQGSEVSEQRQRNHIHYAIDRIGNEKTGRSHHISADVLDGVESQKAFYQEAFTSGRRPVRFLSEGAQDRTYRAATEYVYQQFMDLNDGYGFLRDSFHDAFVAKRCIAKVEWREQYEYKHQPFEGLNPQQLMQMEQMPNVMEIIPDNDKTQWQIGPQGKMPILTGKIEVEVDTSYSDLELVQPERYFRDPNVSFIGEAAFAGFQEDLARHELIDMGFLEDEVMELNLDYRFRQNEEEAARKAHDSSWSRARRHKRQPEQEVVTVYWHWAFLDLSEFIDDDEYEGTRLYKFCWSQGRLLTLPETMEFNDKGEYVDDSGQGFLEAADGMPFFEWTQYKISHSEFGLCEADVLGDLQWTKTNLRRLIIDNQAMTNTTRWKAKHGFIKNPRELLDNNIGSVLWVRDMSALEPLETPAVSPESFRLLQDLDIEKENRTGMSRLAKGMNTDAISSQNAADMIQRLTNASNRRVLRGVRDYAETFLKEIFMHMYNLGIAHDKQKRQIEVDGKYQPVDPASWPERTRMKVQVALTPDQGREQAMVLMGIHGAFQADDDMKKMYGPQQKYNLMTDYMDLMDTGDISRYLMSPHSEEYKAMRQQAAQAAQKQEEMMKMQQQLAMKDDQRKDAEQKRKADELELKQADTASDNLREDERLEHDMNMDFIETGVEISQQRAAKIGD